MARKTETVALEDYKKAYRKMSAKQGKKGFLIHLTAYVVVNSLLTTVNLLFVPEFIWCIFPLVGWGIGLTMHYTFAVRLFDRIMTAEEAKAEYLAKN